MADFLTIAGTPIEIAHGGATQRKGDVVGETARSFSGQLRSTVRATKRAWDFTTAPLTLADAATVRALAGFASCSGDALGGASVACLVTIGDAQYQPDGTGFVVSLALSLVEV